MTNTNAQTTADFFQATVYAVARSIASQFATGDTQEASNRLEQHLGQLSAADGARFIGIVQQFIEAA